MNKLFVVSCIADGGGTDYIIVAAPNSSEAMNECIALGKEVVTAEPALDAIENNYGGIAILSTEY